MPNSKLPTSSDIIRHYFYINNERKAQKLDTSKNSLHLMVKSIYDELSLIWERSSIPIRDETSVKVKISRLLTNKTLVNTMNHIGRIEKENNLTYKQKVLAEFDVLFCIPKCLCFENISSVEELIQSKCNEAVKIPTMEDLQFYFDQKTTRTGTISAKIDKKESQRIQNIQDRNQARINRLKIEQNRLELKKAKEAPVASTSNFECQ